MKRSHYKLFAPGKIGTLKLSNRLVRSATWDPAILGQRSIRQDVLDVYRQLAQGGVGLIISGGLPVYRQRFPDETGQEIYNYDELRVDGIGQMAKVVHDTRPDCSIVAQLEVGYLDAGPTEMVNPVWKHTIRALSTAEIEDIITSFVRAIIDLREVGFDGVQLHAAHGGLLSCFLSPFTNQRTDSYGGSVEKRVRIAADIVSHARQAVGEFPVLIKVNGTDYVEGGIDSESFPALAKELEQVGLDAIEVSGGMWECLARSQDELGFRPVPAPESHTRIRDPRKQSYFLEYAESLDVSIPVILVGGNRHVDRLEDILQGGYVDFIAMSRPFIREPGLPLRWLEGRGGALPECVSCNSCLYEMYEHPGRPEPGVVRCVCHTDRTLHQSAQKWLASWVKDNMPR